MPILEEKPTQLAPKGTHTILLYGLIDLGTQINPFNGNKTRQLVYRFEMPEELMEDGRPFSIDKWYNFSSNDKSNYMIDHNAWGCPLNLGQNPEILLGRAGNGTIVHEVKQNTNKLKAKLVAIAPLKKNEQAPKQVNPSFVFDLDNFSQEAFDKLPDFYKDLISKSPEYQAATGIEREPATPISNNEIDDDIPF